MKHKHADLIIAWANGAPIQWKDRHGQWEDMGEPLWAENHEYRIKPEPKPDYLQYINFHFNLCVIDLKERPFNKANLKLTFDGETGYLKSAEVLSRGQE